SPIYLSGVRVGGSTRDVIVMTTTYGRTLALDAASLKPLWQFQPAGYAHVAGTAQFTTATPLSDGRYVYAASPDGRIHKPRLADAGVTPVDRSVCATSSNGPFDGRTSWGGSILEFSAGVKRLVGGYTPANQQQLEAEDIDLGPTSPAILRDPRSGRPRFLLQ